MRVLALDTSTSACSAAIRDSECQAGEVLAHRFEAMERGQSEKLAPMVQTVLKDAGLGVHDMDFLAVTTGPGAFTGVRIGLAMARALGLSAGLPVLGVPTLSVVAHRVPESRRSDAWTLIVMDTKRDDVYVEIFDHSLSSVYGPDIILPEDFSTVLGHIPEGASVLIAGDVADAMAAHVPDTGHTVEIVPGVLLPDAAVVAEIGLSLGPPSPEAPPPMPVYLRPPYAKISPTGGRLRP